jgi:hypothetical protein
VFITNGPYRATGSAIGLPPSTSTSQFPVPVASCESAALSVMASPSPKIAIVPSANDAGCRSWPAYPLPASA